MSDTVSVTIRQQSNDPFEESCTVTVGVRSGIPVLVGDSDSESATIN